MWFDALTNYVSALGFGGADPTQFAEWWDADGERVHVIGKGIVRFHALIWPAILCSAGLPVPNTLVVHDYVTAGGRKIGKSLGNAVDPQAVGEQFGIDPLRWWLCREVPRVGEVDFTTERLVEVADRDLANGVGNLVQRTVTLAARAFGEDPIRTLATGDLAATSAATRRSIDAALARYELEGRDRCLGRVCSTPRTGTSRQPGPGSCSTTSRRHAPTLQPLVGVTRTIAHELEPFVPDLARRVRERVGDDGEPVAPGPPVQPRL